MRFVSDAQTINNASTTETAAVDASYLMQASAQAVFSDAAAAGTLTLQASNDVPGAAGPQHWDDVATKTVASGAVTMIPQTALCYRWVRVTFASTGGAGTIAVTLQAQGF